MDAIDAVGVLTGGSGLTTEAQALGNELFRQVGLVQYLVHIETRDRDFGGAHEEQFVFGHLIDLGFALGEPAGTHERGLTCEHRNRKRLIALGDHQVSGQTQHGLMQQGAVTAQDIISGTAELDTAFDVDNAQRGPKGHVVLWFKIELPDIPPASDLDITRLIRSHRRIGMRNLGHVKQQVL